MTKIGFIGLGHMGQPMVTNLLKSNYAVTIYDINPDAYAVLKPLGAEIAQNIEKIAEHCDVIITSVQTGDQVKAICLNQDGLFLHAKRDLLFIDCSSIDITTTRELHEEAHKFRISMVDAPVSGGVLAAKAGTLTIMVGGNEKDFTRAQPILSAFGKKIIHAGNGGLGQAAKICNNVLLGISMIGVAEAFTLAKHLGLDEKKFFDISSHASGQCWSMTSYCPVPNIIDNVPANNDYKPGFMAQMMLKDLRLAVHAAELSHTAIPLGGLATELYELFVNQGNGELDFSAIIKMIEAHKNR